jgi:hypothetical protein
MLREGRENFAFTLAQQRKSTASAEGDGTSIVVVDRETRSVSCQYGER